MATKRKIMASNKSIQPCKRRKVDRGFLDIWTEKYFFIEHNGSPICLICQTPLSQFKDYDLKRHYETRHSKYADFTGKSRLEKITKLKSSFKSQTSLMGKQNSETEKSVKASYDICYELAKHMKPFTEGDFIKKCMLLGAENVCPEMVAKFSNISLSRNTVADRISDLAADIKEQSKVCNEDFDYFSIAVDESTDSSDTAQLALFVRGINSDFVVSERFLQLMPLHGTTTGADIFNAVLMCLENRKFLLKYICL